MTNIEDMVADATKTETFSLLTYARGRALAEDTVEVYFDDNAALKLQDLLMGVDIEAKDFEPTDAMKTAMQSLRESKITFYLRAMSPQAQIKLDQKRDASLDKTEDEQIKTDVWESYVNEEISHMIVKSANHAGAVDAAKKTPAEVKTLFELMPPTQIGVFLKAVNKVQFASSAIDASIDAAFLAKA